MKFESGILVWGQSGSLPDPPSLTANAILRLLLCPVALLSIWVPLSQLWRNGEFAACVFVVNNWLMVLIVFVNAALWHNQDFDSWWSGVGWCDLLTYVQYAMMTLLTSSACAIMRRLSKKVGLTRVAGLSARERRNSLLVQSLIMFPVPLLQVVVTVFVSGQRYRIIPVTGCDTGYYPNALYIVFFLVPPPLFTIGTCFHTAQTYRRFREIDASSRETLTSAANTSTSLRRQRARRKLYFMILCIMVPYTPMIVAFLVFDLVQGWPFQFPVTFHFVHNAGIVPWNSVRLLSYAEAGFVTVNLDWIPVVASFVSFVFFGTSKEAIDMYRRTLVAVGLGRVFPRLRTAYDPDRSRATATATTTTTTTGTTTGSTVADSQLSSTGTQLSTACTEATTEGPWSRKGSLAPILPQQQQQPRQTPFSQASASVSVQDRAPQPSAWRSGLRRLVTTARPPYAMLAERQHRQTSTGTDDVELESGQCQCQRQASSVSFGDPFRNPGTEAFSPPSSFPLPFPEPHLQQISTATTSSTTTTTTTTRPILNPGLNWATPPTTTIHDAIPPFAPRRPSAAAAAAAAAADIHHHHHPIDSRASPNSGSSSGRLRRFFPLTAHPSSMTTTTTAAAAAAAAAAAPPPPPGEDTPIYDGTSSPSTMPVFQTMVWSEATDNAKQQPQQPQQPQPQQQQKHKPAPAAAVPRGGGETTGPTDPAAPGVAVVTIASRRDNSGGVRVDQTIVTSKADAE